MRPTTTTRLLVLTFVTFLCARAAAASTVATAGDAAIAHDPDAGTWTLTAGGTTMTLALDASRDLAITDLRTASGVEWAPTAAADSFVRTSRQTLPLGNRASGFALQNVTVDAADNRLQLNAVFDLALAGITVTRHYAIAAGSPTFEVWTSYAPRTGQPNLFELNAFTLTVPPGTVRWLAGLQGDTANVPNDAAFTLQSRAVAPGDVLSLGADGRSSEQTVPWFAIDGAQDEFYAALMWSGAWALSVQNTGPSLSLTLGLAAMTTTLTTAIDGPHAVFGVARGGLPEASAALRSYVLTGIRGGRPLTPLVTYNTWFAYGTEIDEASMRAEMQQAAALGVELFVIDAGWYAGTGAAGPFDFDAGLGSWRADPARFPNGLKPLTDYAHSLGMKFGLWVEPERTNLSLVGAPGVDERWLATHDGDYGSDHAAQICLADSAAKAWILDRLTSLLDEVQPDYLKWDNNMWVNCNREGHGHGSSDGNFAHVNALYDILGSLRARYPDMAIENVSGGGNRLDLAMLRYTDVAWMDDRTAPSVHVRHNVEGLSAVFPPAYLLSFVTNHDTEPVHDAPDLSLYFRSRMAAALGLCFRSADLNEADVTGITHEIDVYKAMRATLVDAAASLLTAQAEAANGPPWDVLQETSSDGRHLLVAAYESDAGVDRINIKLTGLSPTAAYTVQSVDTGVLGAATGADLMATGIDVLKSSTTAAHVLLITAQQ